MYEKLLTVQEAAQILGVSTKTLRRWDKLGILSAQRTLGNQRRYEKKDIERFRKVKTSSQNRPIISVKFGLPRVLRQVPDGAWIRPIESDTPVVSAPSSPLFQPVEPHVPEAGRSEAKTKSHRPILLGLILVCSIFAFAFSIKYGLGQEFLSGGGKLSYNDVMNRVMPNLFGHLKRNEILNQVQDDNGRRQARVLAETTVSPRIVLNVNVPSTFNQSAEFIKGLHAVEIATLSGGLITENQDVNAGTGRLTASNVLYGATAGTGISVGTGQTPTITNTDLGSSQNIFKKITVGSDTINAGSNTDTLTFAAGSNITLSTDTSSKKVTIAAASAGAASGWTDDGTAVRLTTATDSVGIGTTSPSSKLDVLSTTEQLRLLYDSSNYTSFTIGSSGDLTLNPTGGDVIFADADVLNIGGSGSDTAYNIIGDSSSGASSIVDSDDDLYIEGNIEIDGTVRLNNVSYTFPSADGSNTYIMQTNGSGTLSWIDPGTLPSSNFWDRDNGAIYPKMASVLDLLVGGTSSVSAKFAFINVNSGTPTASISANSGDNAAFITGLGNLATTNMQTLTLGGSSTGNIVIDSGNGIVRVADLTTNGVVYTSAGNGTLNTEATLDETRGGTGLDTSGVTDGQLLIGNDAANGFTLAALTAGSGITITNGAGSITVAQTGVGASKWTQASGTLYPNISTLDLLIGGTATTSAKFGLINVNSGTPTASISANSGNNAAFLTGAGNLATTNRQTLTLGGSTTGLINVANGAGSTFSTFDTVNSRVGIGITAPARVLDIQGGLTGTELIKIKNTTSGSGDVSGLIFYNNDETSRFEIGVNSTGHTFASTGYLWMRDNFPLRIGTNDTERIRITNDGNVGIGTSSPLELLHVAGNATASGNLTLSGAARSIQTTAMNTLTLGGSTTGNIVIDSGNAVVRVADLTTNGVVYTSAGNGTLNTEATLDETRGGTGLDTSGVTDGQLLIGNDALNGFTLAALTQGSGITITNGAGSITIAQTGVGASKWTQANGTLYPNISTQDLLVGGTSTASAKFAVLNVNSGTPTASISANSGNNATILTGLGVLGTTNMQTLTLGNSTTGEVSLAPGGTTALTARGANLIAAGTLTGLTGLTSSGTITFSGFTSNGGPLYTNGSGVLAQTTAGTATQVLHGGTTPSFSAVSLTADVSGILPTANGGSWWNSSSGALYPGNSTMDLLIGATSTASAKFGFINVNSGTPTATISANSGNNATYLTGNGTLATTNRQTLILGSSSTGDIELDPTGLLGIYILASGEVENGNPLPNVGINTRSPLARLHVAGNATASGNLTLSGAARSIQTTALNTLTLGGATTGNVVIDSGSSVISFSDAITLTTLTGNNSALYSTSGTGVVAAATTSTTSLCLTSGASAPSWVTCPGSGSGGSKWTESGAALYPNNATVDLLVGGTSTTSAKFAFINVNSGTPTATISANSGNNAAFLTGGGNLATTNAQTLTIGGSTTGNITIDSGSSSITLSDATTANGLITAAAGLTVSSGQNLTLAGITGNNASLYGTSGTGVVAGATTSTANLCLTSGASAPSWVTCPGSGSGGSKWTESGAALYPNNATVDLLVGGTSTTSAKFSFYNVNSGTPTASLSAGTAGGAYLNATGTLSTTAMQTLTLGGSTTGNISIDSGSSSIRLLDALNAGGAATAAYNFFASDVSGASTPDGVADLYIQDELEVDGTVRFNNLTYTFPSSETANYLLQTNGAGALSWTDLASHISNYWRQTSGALYPANSTVDLLVGGTSTTSAKFGFLNVNSGTPRASISANSGNIATYITGDGTLATTNRQTLTIGNSSTYNTTGNVLINPNGTGNVGIGTTSPTNLLVVTGGDVALEVENTTDATSNQTAIFRGNNRATPANNDEAYISLTLDDSTGAQAEFGRINWLASDVSSGSKDSRMNFYVQNDNSLVSGLLLTDNQLQLNARGSASSPDFSWQDDINSGIFKAANDQLGFSGGGVEILRIVQGSSGSVGIRTTSPLATLDVRPGSGTIAIASASGSTSFAAMVADSTGAGDIFTASRSGATKFVILNSGDIQLAGQTNFLTTLASAATAARTITFPDATGTICLSSSNCASSAFWNQASGLLYAGNTTVDVAIGGTSTASAKFGFINVNSGTPTASVSAGSAGGAYLTATGTLATTARQTLTLGDSSTTGMINVFSTGDLTLDSSTDIVLDADGADVFLKDAGTTFATFTNTITDLTIDASGGNILSSDALNFGGESAQPYNYFASVVSGASTPDGVADLYIQDELEVDGTTTFGDITYTWPTTQTINYVLSTNGTGTLSWTDAGTLPSVNFWDRSSGAVFPKIASVHDVLLGSTATSSSKFAFINVNSGTPTASISANSGNNATILTGTGNLGTVNQGTLTLGGATTGEVFIQPNADTGDYFRFLSDGTNLTLGTTDSSDLTINTDGNNILSPDALNIGGAAAAAYNFFASDTSGVSTPDGVADLYIQDELEVDGTVRFNNLTYTFPSGGESSGFALTTNGSGTLSWADLGVSVSNYWRQTDGAVYTANSTVDLLVGGTSTGSAKFAFINVNSGTPTATIAGNIVLDAAGTIQTTKQQTLTLGGTTTGNITIDSGSSQILLADQTDIGSSANGIRIDTAGAISDINANVVIDDTVDLGSAANGINITTAGVISDNNADVIINDHLDPNTDATFDLGDTTTSWRTLYLTGSLCFDDSDCVESNTAGGFWDRTNGAVYPKIASVHDLLLGSTATSSSKFAFINVNSGTPTASISANSGNNATILTGAGNLGTVNQGTLTLGGATTGEVFIQPNADTGDYFRFLSDGTNLTLATTDSSDLTINTDGNNILSPDALNFGGAAAAAYNFFASDTSGVSTPDGVADLYVQDELEVDGTVRFNNLTYTFPSGGESSGFALTTNGSGTLSWADLGVSVSNYWRQASGVVYTANSTVDLLVGGTSTASAKFAVLNVNSGTPTASVSAGSAGGAYLNATGTLATTARQTLTLGDSSTTGMVNVFSTGDLTLDSTTDIVLDADGADVFLKDAGTTFATFTNSTTDLTLDIVGGDLILADADVLSIGQTTFTDVAYNVIGDATTGADGTLLNSDDDLYIEGELEVDGQIRLGNLTYTFPTSGQSSGFSLTTNGSGTLSWSDLGASIANYWRQVDGVVYTANSTVDLLVGGTASTSAKFAVLNVNSGTPTASVSAGTAGGAYLTAAGLLQTTANQTLTFGGNTTGNITLSPLNGGASGIINLNTTNLQIAGTAGSTVASAACVTTVDGIVTGSAACPAGETSTQWDLNNGALNPKIATVVDLLLGATSTASAKFGFINVNSGTPTATISANSGNNAAFLTGGGNLATTNRQTLTIGGSTTGDVVVDGNNFDVTGSGNVDFGGTITAGTGNEVITLSTGKIDADAIGLITGDGAGGTSSGSGLETDTDRLGLLQGCADTQVLKWDNTNNLWQCGSDRATSQGILSANLNLTGTFQNVTNVSFSVGANEDWYFEMFIQAQINVTSDVKFRTNAPAGSNCEIAYAFVDANIDNVEVNCGVEQQFTTLSATELGWATGSVQTEGTSGTVQLQAATVDGGSNGSISSGSAVLAYRVDGADLAEVYYTKGKTLDRGTVVSLDPSLEAGVIESGKPYDRNLIGIVSKKPGLLIGSTPPSQGGTPVWVALSGRVPVKVSTENGNIRPGDYLTSSSIPGVAMRATKAGTIIAQALTGYSGTSALGEAGEVIAFVKTTFAQGTKIADLIPVPGLTPVDSTSEVPDPSTSEVLLGKQVLEYLITKKNSLVSTDLSEIITDRLVAGLEIITPRVVAEELDAGTIVAGTITADKIKANQIEGLEIFTDKIASLSSVIAGISTDSASLALTMSEPSVSVEDLEGLAEEVKSLSSKVDLLTSTASISGLLSQSPDNNFADVDILGIKDATISGSLAVLGRTTLTDLGVTGSINAGLLSIHGLDDYTSEESRCATSEVTGTGSSEVNDNGCASATINTLSGNLYLQNHGLGGIDVLSGKITIDTKGNLTVVGTITANEIEADSYTVLGKESIGSGTIPAGSTSIEVSTAIASQSSKIFLTTTSLTDKQIAVVGKSNGKFKVAIPEPTTSPITFDWWIVGNKN